MPDMLAIAQGLNAIKATTDNHKDYGGSAGCRADPEKTERATPE
jgi:hypothetical protein